MKLLLITLAIALISYANAECNNMCSGHGSCGANDACTCYRNWRGNDCSERTCQFGIAFIDTPRGDLNHDGVIDTAGASTRTQWHISTEESFKNFGNHQAHDYMECSNAGICDRSTGECVCFDGHEGSACQRTSCPNSCSGNGICRDLYGIGEKHITAANKAAVHGQNPLWDAKKNQACVCDPGYSGVDCSQRLCPKGHDPLDTGKIAQTQRIACSTSNSADHQLEFKDLFGETWKTAKFDLFANTGADLKAALEGLPNGVIDTVTVGVVDGTTYDVDFDTNPGTQNLLSFLLDANTCAVTQQTAATNVAQECSGRGLCDYDTGLCKCFRGYRLADCSSQHALAFGSTTSSF